MGIDFITKLYYYILKYNEKMKDLFVFTFPDCSSLIVKEKDIKRVRAYVITKEITVQEYINLYTTNSDTTFYKSKWI